MQITRVIVAVLDGVGAGEMPDASEYGDSGSNTLGNTAQAVGGLSVPNLARLGLGRIIPIKGVPADSAIGCYGRMNERSPGKDSVTGHWEMMGIVLEKPFPTYPNGFPAEVILKFEAAIGARTLGNFPSSGTEIIKQLGEAHVQTGYPIVYTSADSVFQIAAHESVIPVERLNEICRIARKQLNGEHAVGRVIARPFEGERGEYRRTERRKDFPLDPPRNVLDMMAESSHNVHAIGKIPEFFNNRGIRTQDFTTNNREHERALTEAIRSNQSHLIFANLEDFDMLYGHRNDPRGFANAVQRFDVALGDMIDAAGPSDLLILTNDHGNDPTTPSTDHSREYAFLLAYAPALRGAKDLGTRGSFADIGATILEVFGLPRRDKGESCLGVMR